MASLMLMKLTPAASQGLGGREEKGGGLGLFVEDGTSDVHVTHTCSFSRVGREGGRQRWLGTYLLKMTDLTLMQASVGQTLSPPLN